MNESNPRFGIFNLPPLVTLSAIAAVVLTGVVAVFVLLGQSGSPAGTAGPGAAGATLASGATAGPAGTTTTGNGGGGACTAGTAGDNQATLTISGGGAALGLDCAWLLDGSSGDLSPTDTLIAGIWAEAVDNLEGQYGDLIVVTVSGPVPAAGATSTVSTGDPGVILGFSVSRIDAAGNDLFSHTFTSKAGECQVTMTRDAAGMSGTFSCASISDADGHTVSATGSFRT